MIKYSIVVPTLNERDNIIPLIKNLEALGLPDLEIIVVDENSPDGTAAAVNEYSNGNENIRAILNDGLPGLSPSIVKGFSEARGELLCCMDGDLQHSPDDVSKLLNTAEEMDMVIGSRYIEGGGFAEKWHPFRVLVSRTAAFMSRILPGVKLHDPMSGFFVIRRSAFEREKHLLDPRGFKIMLELYFILKNSPREYRAKEYGITFGLRSSGKSKLNSRIIVQYMCQLLALFRRTRQIRHDTP